MVEIDTLFQTKTAEKNIPFGAAHTHIAYIRDSPPPPTPGAKNAFQIMSLAAYTSETNEYNKWMSLFRLLKYIANVTESESIRIMKIARIIYNSEII